MTPPTSGCARRSRSSAASESTDACDRSSITGPTGIASSPGIGIVRLLEHDECADDVALVADRQMAAIDAATMEPSLDERREAEVRATQLVVDHRYSCPFDRRAHPGACRLGERFLRRPALCEPARDIMNAGYFLHFIGAQDVRAQPLAVAPPDAADPLDRNQVGADAADHRSVPASAAR